MAGELVLDGGHTGHQSGTLSFLWLGPGPRDEDEIARAHAELADAALVPLTRRIAIRDGDRTMVVHEADRSPAAGGEALLWPPIAGPLGVLLRHAVVTDDGRHSSAESQPPWLLALDGTITQLPFELGVSPLLAMPDGRWLLPGADALWRDGYDEPLSLLAADGGIEALLVGGAPVPASRVLREAVPELLAGLQPVDPDDDVPWETVGARLAADAGTLHLAVELVREENRRAVVVAALPLDGTRPAHLLAHVEPEPGLEVALAP